MVMELCNAPKLSTSSAELREFAEAFRGLQSLDFRSKMTWCIHIDKKIHSCKDQGLIWCCGGVGGWEVEEVER